MKKSLGRFVSISKTLALAALLSLGSLLSGWQPVRAFGGGDGTPGNPFEITSCDDIADMALDLSASYELMFDIDCSLSSFGPIGSPATPFSGTFNGNGASIDNLSIVALGTEAGLFGYTNGATISNVTINNGNFFGNDSVGAIVGYAGYTTISRVNAINTTVESTGDGAGGVVGTLGGSQIEKSTAINVNVTGGGSYVGGIVGYVVGPSSVSNSYATGTVSGSAASTGGVIGQLGIGPAVASYLYADTTFTSAGSDVIGVVAMGGMPSANFMASAPYLSNSTQSPLDSWDFDSVWYVRTGNYPGLRPYYTLSMLCNPPSSTNTSITGSCTSYPANLQTSLTWDIEYKPDTKPDWINRPSQVADTFSDTVSGLVPGTNYTLKFRHASVLGVSEWGTMSITTTGLSDSDGDSVSNIDEAYAPNNGDGNNDGIADYLQDNVSSVLNSTTSKYAVVTTSCGDNYNVMIGMEASGVQADTIFDYPYGLVGFVGRNCGVGATVDVEVIFYGTSDTSLVLRKSKVGVYRAVPATITSVTIGGQNALKATYRVTDGGIYDDDGIADGNIVDPIGIAQSAIGAPNTGFKKIR